MLLFSVLRHVDLGLDGFLHDHLNERSGLIGRAGETLWISFLLRKDVANDESVYVGMSPAFRYDMELLRAWPLAAAPQKPDAYLSAITIDLDFACILAHLGDQPGGAALDEIRVA